MDHNSVTHLRRRQEIKGGGGEEDELIISLSLLGVSMKLVLLSRA